LAKTVFKGGVYFVDNVVDLKKIFDEDVRLVPWMIPHHWVEHLKTRYQSKPGVQGLGYEVVKPILMVKPKSPSRPQKEQRPSAEMLVVCKQGNMSREEALGIEGLPNEAEVLKRAAAIRKQHEANGVVRNGEFVGFSLQRVVQRPKLSLA